ncbi:MAG: thiamine pyrophosphate-dependent dehydrogenase E1 component subunit alpha [Sedimentisphaerales bacterium]|nr:thiamine pyrophosphate-dependent dehydrogenase E1 component subunit alpha [Sedimentisphaerales bacterium]
MKSHNRKSLNLDLYQKLYLIRKSEEKIVEHYFDDEMKTPMHMSMGSEAVSVGVCHALGPESQVFGTYRSHALYLAKTGDTDDFFAEMYGKETAFLKGVGGSMHLCAPKDGFMGTSAIVASAIPVAVGAAFADKRLNNKKTVAVFFGDGAIDEGVFWESLNAACLMYIPMLFVCEDNGLAVHTPAHQRHGYDSIAEVVSTFHCHVFQDKTTDPGRIYELSCKAMEKSRATQQPSFLHLKYYRYLEHVGVNEDFDAGYRSKDEFEEWLKVDPVRLQRTKLQELGWDEREIRTLEKGVEEQIDSSLTRAQKAPLAENSAVYTGVME